MNDANDLDSIAIVAPATCRSHQDGDPSNRLPDGSTSSGVILSSVTNLSDTIGAGRRALPAIYYLPALASGARVVEPANDNSVGANKP